MYKKTNVIAFSTLITVYDDFISSECCSKLFDFCKGKEIKCNQQFVGNGSSYFSLSSYILDEIEKEKIVKLNLKSKIQEVLSDYSCKFGINPVKITNSWFNFQEKESILKNHSHENSIFSGALYLNANENSSQICFENPNPFISYFNFENSIINPNNFSSKFFKVQPKTGQLIIFPSWINHGSNYEKNNMKGRLVLSFNSI